MIRVQRSGLQVAEILADFIEREALPDTGIDKDLFWNGFESLIKQLAPANQALLHKRDYFQKTIDAWHLENEKDDFDTASYKAFLEDIGYLSPEPEDFQITTDNVDPEIANIAGPQLVVPVNNERYALNAANARYPGDQPRLGSRLRRGAGARGEGTVRKEMSLLWRKINESVLRF